jgi:hypothetical protein
MAAQMIRTGTTGQLMRGCTLKVATGPEFSKDARQPGLRRRHHAASSGHHASSRAVAAAIDTGAAVAHFTAARD